jgi:hypothetical protein
LTLARTRFPGRSRQGLPDLHVQRHYLYLGTSRSPRREVVRRQRRARAKHFGGPTWEAKDDSSVVGTVAAKASAPSPHGNAIPWLLEPKKVGRFLDGHGIELLNQFPHVGRPQLGRGENCSSPIGKRQTGIAS